METSDKLHCDEETVVKDKEDEPISPGCSLHSATTPVGSPPNAPSNPASPTPYSPTPHTPTSPCPTPFISPVSPSPSNSSSQFSINTAHLTKKQIKKLEKSDDIDSIPIASNNWSELLPDKMLDGLSQTTSPPSESSLCPNQTIL